MVTAISPIAMVRIRGTQRAVRNIQITDGRETLPVSLWGPHANQFDAEGVQAEANKHPVIMLFVGVTSKIRERQLTLYGSTICKWYSNPIIPEVVALQQSLAAKPHEITWFGQPSTKNHACNATVPEIADLNPHDIMVSTQRRTQFSVWPPLLTIPALTYALYIVLDMIYIILHGNTYIVNIAIKEIIPGDAWWYIAYLKKDHPITANFTFFGPVAEELIGIPPLTLVASVQGQRDLVPTEIARLYGRQLTVRVSASRRSLQMFKISYQVESMTFLPSEVPYALPSLQNIQPLISTDTARKAGPSSTGNQISNIEPPLDAVPEQTNQKITTQIMPATPAPAYGAQPATAIIQKSATDFIQQIQIGQATVHIPPTHEDLSQPIGSEPVLDLNIQDDPAPEQYVYVPGVSKKKRTHTFFSKHAI
uniref:Replication protein A OB domain-containing protein n=1 Tax=Oryza punctata TaxID=4537 RepID=A0A0E0KZ84_ORYPU